ncbi:hypothetical protein LTR84_000789 [Exophiala bonariae]|uniref:Uncharacterized protein n=1 Tax=Exophiala bonariae TaxID=1690606 RepID=A0AAV9NU41_9EURO|nr:hypothetical protein LTR84_000789 [Exophiala bonariae]
MPPARVPSQQLNSLSGSPTTGTANTNNTTNNTASVRRSLFSAHLSRRPASGSQSSSQGSSTQPHLQPNQHPTAPDQEPSQHRLPRPTHATNAPAPGHAPPPTVSQIQAASRRYQHQRSVSTPSLSPSPPRLSPFHNLPPAAAFGHNVVDITTGGPPFAPTPPRHMTAAADTYDYDPTISPNRPLSPRSRETLFPNSSIIAVNPVTGRPILPHLPVLPGRLRLSDEDGGADHEDEGDEDPEGTPDAGIHHRRHHRHQPSDPDMIHTQSSTAAMMHAAAEDEASLEADEERRDRERIERMLREMMARQRARAKLGTTHKPSSTNMVGDGPPSGSSAVNVSSGGVRKRSTHQHHGRGQRHRHMSPLENGGGDEHDDEDHELYAAEDADSEESEAEREELMGLITASLRREVARAEDEGWMYGDSGMGVGGGWDGREEGLVGGYE